MEDSKEYKTLVDAVDRYIQSDEYPSIEIICAILGIKRKDVKKCTWE